ncbi:hypothetical protein CEXT_119561 [Caerostris extrusa]|uniref:Uncharacterized protein n=1 Tax=Caerostris extrusa TaxID=172846 RepID=A0AAV4VV42_CAEEX|nr:hypothetical protein CEXT_119561 [Caerostris extrusa]
MRTPPLPPPSAGPTPSAKLGRWTGMIPIRESNCFSAVVVRGFLSDLILDEIFFMVAESGASGLFPFGPVDSWLNNKSLELDQGELVGFGPGGGDGSA